MKKKLMQLLSVTFSILLISCNTADNTALEAKLDTISDDQKVILKKMSSLEKTVKNLELASKNQPANNKNKQQPPQADPNKVYNIPVGDSFTKGPDAAAVTLIEWTDFQ